MKTILITLEGKPEGIHLANKMKQAGFLDLIIVEKSKKEKSKKLRRMLFKKIWRLPLNALDVIAAFAYLKKVNSLMRKELLEKNSFRGFPKGVETFETNSVNSRQCIKMLESMKPDVVVVIGSSILSQEAISTAKKYCLNVHGGMLPKYRGVRGEFWAMYHDDLENYGPSIVHLDPGLDTGDVAFQQSIELRGGESLAEMKVENTRLGAELALKAVRLASQGKEIPRQKQDKSKREFFRTPGFLDYVKLFLKKR